jgi:hypothetical protein
MFGLKKSVKQQPGNQVDAEITKIMGLPPDEAAARMSSKTTEPVIVDDTAPIAEDANNDLSKSTAHRLKKFFTGWRH